MQRGFVESSDHPTFLKQHLEKKVPDQQTSPSQSVTFLLSLPSCVVDKPSLFAEGGLPLHFSHSPLALSFSPFNSSRGNLPSFFGAA